MSTDASQTANGFDVQPEESTLAHLKERVECIAEEGREKLQSAGVSAEEFIRREPFKALVAAAALGAFAGLIFKRS